MKRTTDRATNWSRRAKTKTQAHLDVRARIAGRQADISETSAGRWRFARRTFEAQSCRSKWTRTAKSCALCNASKSTLSNSKWSKQRCRRRKRTVATAMWSLTRRWDEVKVKLWSNQFGASFYQEFNATDRIDHTRFERNEIILFALILFIYFQSEQIYFWDNLSMDLIRTEFFRLSHIGRTVRPNVWQCLSKKFVFQR